MDAQRAQEICSSSEMANVTCNGEQIYIEHVDQETGKATIHSLNNPEQKQSVDVSSLNEQ
ncbi:small acid-soluble spore protein H [Bacillus sp. NEB1478]|uniref:small acid-soluble spore protein H n=1 Tax=Bacillus sp. NEB1478 TaxID=3073816 RepID=UPI0028731633|nr:small acid-soluble spore protein H [Bacillus sp. NEB1478]WNB90721.1 small acid-soluble spore protein H [Bacillus sp. NEB1478]